MSREGEGLTWQGKKKNLRAKIAGQDEQFGRSWGGGSGGTDGDSKEDSEDIGTSVIKRTQKREAGESVKNLLYSAWRVKGLKGKKQFCIKRSRIQKAEASGRGNKARGNE